MKWKWLELKIISKFLIILQKCLQFETFFDNFIKYPQTKILRLIKLKYHKLIFTSNNTYISLKEDFLFLTQLYNKTKKYYL